METTLDPVETAVSHTELTVWASMTKTKLKTADLYTTEKQERMDMLEVGNTQKIWSPEEMGEMIRLYFGNTELKTMAAPYNDLR